MCERHCADISRYDHYAFHPMGPDCGMPGAAFCQTENVCRVPASLDEETVDVHEHTEALV